jgi:hypothetical protein
MVRTGKKWKLERGGIWGRLILASLPAAEIVELVPNFYILGSASYWFDAKGCFITINPL